MAPGNVQHLTSNNTSNNRSPYFLLLVAQWLEHKCGTGSNPGGLVQSQLLQGGTHLAAAYIHVDVNCIGQ